MEWLMKLIDRLANFLFEAKEDLQAFDEHVQAEIVKYKNKQCIKAVIIGGCIGVVVGILVGKI